MPPTVHRSSNDDKTATEDTQTREADDNGEPCSKSFSAAQNVRDFRYQNHSLRINVCDLAACAGFHRFKPLPKLLLDHVYQGIHGQALLRQDANLLGLKIVSDEQTWLELARQAGESTQQALKKALQVPTGQTKLASVQAAEELLKTVAHEAKTSKKLSIQQLATLKDGARHSIYTGFGTVWESQALDLYEKHCGWEVAERNAEVRVWDFDATGQELGPPRSNHPQHQRESNYSMGEQPECQIAEKNLSNGSKRQKVDNGEEVVASDLPVIIDVDLQGDVEPSKSQAPPLTTGGSGNREETSSPLPYFSLRGSVDGIRQEMAPVAQQNKTNKGEISCSDDDVGFDDDITWEFRRVVVECKHRMRNLFSSLPIYEMIQATAYCLMYETGEADLVQVLRNRFPLAKKTDHKNDANENGSVTKIDLSSSQKVAAAKNEVDGSPNMAAGNDSQPITRGNRGHIQTDASGDGNTDKEPTAGVRQDQQEAAPSMEISVTRISIDDQVYQHRQNWEIIILPRLQSWTQAVYAVRKDDDKRYRLLAALSTENLQDAWDVLLKECPWLQGCDTSYRFDISRSTLSETK